MASAVQPLTIPTYEDSGVVTHPSFVRFDTAWNGYTYWMAFTPYPGGNDDFENPSIVASNDGLDWEIPSGLTNPIEPFPGGAAYNSDVHLVYADDGYLYCFWRVYDATLTNQEERIYYRRSNDGRTWGDKTLVFEFGASVRRMLSPSFIQLGDGSWRMYAVDIKPTTPVVVTATAPALSGPWTTPSAISGLSMAGRDPWHMDAHLIEGEFVIFVDDKPAGGAGAVGQVWRAVSTDGVTFTTDPYPAATTRAYYRCSFQPVVTDCGWGYEVIFGTLTSFYRGLLWLVPPPA